VKGGRESPCSPKKHVSHKGTGQVRTGRTLKGNITCCRAEEGGRENAFKTENARGEKKKLNRLSPKGESRGGARPRVEAREKEPRSLLRGIPFLQSYRRRKREISMWGSSN